VGGKLISRFAGNLAEEITRDEPAEAAPEASAPPAEEPQAADAAAEPQVAPADSKATGAGTPEAPQRAAAKPAVARSSDDDAINLLEFAGPSIAKRLAPVVAGLAALWALQRLVRRRGRRSAK
jgi:predicted flap endonuclease-1-like 5' DNA nuclease